MPYDDTIFSTLERIEAMQGVRPSLGDLASLVTDFKCARDQIRQLRSDLVALESELDIARSDLEDAQSQLADADGVFAETRRTSVNHV